jgi:lysozyme
MSAPQQLREQLIRDEGEVHHAYQDHLGFWTIGVGRLIDKRKGGGITHEEAMYLLDNDIARKSAEVLAALPWAQNLGQARQCVLVAMAFQMGTAGLLNFRSTLRLVQAGDFSGAARQMLRSLWARQTPKRAQRLAKQMETGEWQ